MDISLSTIDGEYDDQLDWPMEVKVCLELLNQVGDHHVVKTKNWKARSNTLIVLQINYSELENKGDDVTYVVDDCIKFRIHITVL